jgi:hypothetical protein
MDSIEVAVAMGILFAFALGMAIGLILVVSFASRREDRQKSLWREPPDPACGGARLLVGAGVRGGSPASGFRDPGEDDDPGSGQESER